MTLDIPAYIKKQIYEQEKSLARYHITQLSRSAQRKSLVGNNKSRSFNSLFGIYNFIAGHIAHVGHKSKNHGRVAGYAPADVFI